MVPLGEITTLPGNPRRGDVERIKASLARFGQRYPAVLRDGIMIAGNHRLQAMRELGWTHIICCDADDLTEDEARAFALADNRSSDVATYNLDDLETELARLDDELRLAAGYTPDDLADLMAGLDNAPVPGFTPDDGDQPRLDQRNAIQCPNCAFEWRTGPHGEIEPV
jgi:ParB-like chromosome segregation protein Spo0J